MGHCCQFLRRDTANELSPVVSVEWSQNKAIAPSNDPFTDDTLILLISNVRQHRSYSNEHRNIPAPEALHSMHTLARGRGMRFHTRSGVPATERHQRAQRRSPGFHLGVNIA